jgi:hypothetical protein
MRRRLEVEVKVVEWRNVSRIRLICTASTREAVNEGQKFS